MIRAFTIVGAVLVLAGCETTSADLTSTSKAPAAGHFAQTEYSSFGNNGYAATTSEIDPATGRRVVTGGSLVIGSGNVAPAGAMMGSWILADDFARRCTLSLTASPLSGSGGAMEVQRAGFCSSEFSGVSGWMAAGTGIALTDATGRIQGQLVADNRGGYTGTYNSAFGPASVKLTRDGF